MTTDEMDRLLSVLEGKYVITDSVSLYVLSLQCPMRYCVTLCARMCMIGTVFVSLCATIFTGECAHISEGLNF